VDVITVTSTASAVTVAATSITTALLRARSQRQLAREASRQNCLRELPPGSHVIDLGEHGMIIYVGDPYGEAGRVAAG